VLAVDEELVMRKTCSYKIYDGTRADMFGHSCTRLMKVIENGKPLCNLHSAAGLAKARYVREARWAEESKALEEKYAREAEKERKAKDYDALARQVETLKLALEQSTAMLNVLKDAKYSNQLLPEMLGNQVVINRNALAGLEG
jgi:hypothetical protein